MSAPRPAFLNEPRIHVDKLYYPLGDSWFTWATISFLTARVIILCTDEWVRDVSTWALAQLYSDLAQLTYDLPVVVLWHDDSVEVHIQWSNDLNKCLR